MKGFQVHIISELEVSNVEASETLLNAAIDAVSDAIVQIAPKEPFVFGELTSDSSWALRVEFAAEADTPEQLFDEIHRTSRTILRALGLPPNLAIAIKQSAELIPA